MNESAPSEAARLGALVGRWKTQGTTRESPDVPPVSIEATDTYEWLPGEFGLLHRVDARMGEERVEGAEIIGYEPARGCYVTQYFGSDGPNAYEASLDDERGALTWRMQSRSDRFTGTFSPDGERIDGHWERRRDDGTWAPWMEITLTRQSDHASASGRRG